MKEFSFGVTIKIAPIDAKNIHTNIVTMILSILVTF